ncbi:hypothetical protein ALR00_02198 [Pseudomonas savastanoi pv. retacarpa]|nr:hypothetical protein ALR00_02198 [Pseudomonas savastanoi pv. retacarpa]
MLDQFGLADGIEVRRDDRQGICAHINHLFVHFNHFVRGERAGTDHNRHTSCHGFDSDSSNFEFFRFGKGEEFAIGAQYEKPVNACIQEVFDQIAQGLLVELLISGEGCDQSWDDAAKLHGQVLVLFLVKR